MFTLLKQRNFGLLFGGRVVTNIGDSIYFIAAMWLVYELGGSAFYSGLAGFLTQIPQFMQILVGPLIDRWTLKSVLIWTQLLQAVLVLVIPLAHFLGFLNVALVLIIMPLLSFIETFAYPAQTKALPTILKKDELTQGNSLFSIAYQGVDLVFNAAAGLLIAAFGAIALYIADSFTFAVALLFFSLLKLPKQTAKEKKQISLSQALTDYKYELKQGIGIIFTTLIGAFLIGSVICNFAIGAGLAVLPAFGDLQGGSEVYGFYLAAMSCGSLAGAFLSSAFGKLKIGQAAIVFVVTGAISWGAAALVPWTWVSILLYGAAWLPIGCMNILFAAAIQGLLPHYLLGRINAATTSFSMAAMPIGSLLGGYFAAQLGSRFVFFFAGTGLLLLGLVWLLHPRLRNLPEMGSLTPDLLGLKDIDTEQESS